MVETASQWAWKAAALFKRAAEDADSDTDAEAGQKEIFASWSLFILIMLVIFALFFSYILQARKIQAVHETVVSIFAGMFVGLILRLSAAQSVLGLVSFDYQIFFNLLLPPIILASGYELHQGNFFPNIGTILTFAFAGTFISALVLGIVLWLWALVPLEAMNLSFVEAISVGATLSATDPVTILSIFNTYKVDPKLYTVVFGESILNDAVAIVIFETAQRYKPNDVPSDIDEEITPAKLTFFSLFRAFGFFLLVFFGSLIIGLAVGVATSLLLKLTHVRRFPKIEGCLILLIAYASYFFANAVHLSGIVSLLFCGICLKHYAYHNMSRRTQLSTKFIFQGLAQLSENFIFIYLGLSLFTETGLEFRPLFILVAIIGICLARWLAVFPLSSAINWVLRYRARRRGREPAEELPFSHQAMLFWAGLRGAVGVALAASITGTNSMTLKATVLVVVVLTVIIFGGTTARMLEILGIKTGVADEMDSDDEFDIEVVHNGGYPKRYNSGFGHTSKNSGNGIPLSGGAFQDDRSKVSTYSSGSARASPSDRPGAFTVSRKNSRMNLTEAEAAAQGLLGSHDADDEEPDLGLPPQVRRATITGPLGRGELGRAVSMPGGIGVGGSTNAGAGAASNETTPTASRSIRSFLQGSAEDPATWFRQLDEGFIKPKLLLDPGDGSNTHGNGSSGV